MISLLYLLFLSYLVGSIPTGVILASYFTEIDIQHSGSGNIGATNVYRLTGRKLGLLTLIGDAAKGFAMVMLAFALLDSRLEIGLVALAAFIGHCYSVFLGYKGGKGVAVAFGDFLALAPGAALLALAVWLAVFYRFRKSSLGALIAGPLLLLFMALIPAYRAHVPLTLVMVAILVHRHRENIQRLMQGRER